MAAARQWARDPSVAGKARAAAAEAVARAPNLAESHVAFAVVRYQERLEPEAVRALKRALVLSPANAEAHDMMGRILAETRLLDEAQGHLEAALTVEPDTQLARVSLGRLHMVRGAVDKAAAIATAQDIADPALLPMIGRYCLWTRDVERARAVLEELAKSNHEMRLTRVMLGAVARGEAPWELLPPPTEVNSRFHAFMSQIAAEAAGFLGDVERGLAYTEQASIAGTFDLAWMDGCPLLAGLRDHPRFQAARVAVEARAAAIEAAYLEPV